MNLFAFFLHIPRLFPVLENTIAYMLRLNFVKKIINQTRKKDYTAVFLSLSEIFELCFNLRECFKLTSLLKYISDHRDKYRHAKKTGIQFIKNY